jgi:hypothetical protein
MAMNLSILAFSLAVPCCGCVAEKGARVIRQADP